jgi:hypothetical protein
MTQDKIYVNEFIKNIFDDNFAEAKANLQNAINEKIKGKLKGEIEDIKEKGE